MRHYFIVSSQENLSRYQELVASLEPALSHYKHYLRESVKVIELPEAILWSEDKPALDYLSGRQYLPAYTNDSRIVLTPDIQLWKSLYLAQLAPYSQDKVHHLANYYRKLDEKKTIL